MGLIPRRCKDPSCARLIVYSEQDQVYVDVDGPQKGQPHRLSCCWKPYSTIPYKNGNKPVGELILISQSQFDEAMKSIDDQFKSTQLALSKSNALLTETLAKVDAILRGGR